MANDIASKMMSMNVPHPQPSRPEFYVAYDPKTMSLAEYLNSKYDPSGLAKFKGEAMRSGPSTWAGLAKQSNLANVANEKETSARSANAATAQAMDVIAARGGLSSGARERAATEGAKNALAMGQDISRQGDLNNLQIGMNDESNRIQQLSMLPGMQQSEAGMYTQAKGGDISNQIAEINRRNQYNQNVYNQQMQGWAANQQANATMAAGNGGTSFICSALRGQGLMNKRETVLMTKFMLKSIFRQAHFLFWYFRKGWKAVEIAEKQNFDFSQIKKEFVDDILMTKKMVGQEAAEQEYVRKAAKFVQQFTGDKYVGMHKICSIAYFPALFFLPKVREWCRGYFRGT